jgi:hypothetical protein
MNCGCACDCDMPNVTPPGPYSSVSCPEIDEILRQIEAGMHDPFPPCGRTKACVMAGGCERCQL